VIDVFKVGVHIGMTTNSSQVLSVMLRQLLGIEVAASKVQGMLGKIRTAAIGAGMVFAGWEVTKGLWHAIENNRELNKELEKTKQLGGDFAKNIGATRAQAIRTQGDVPTSTLAGNVRLAREIGMTLGHPDAANSLLSAAAKAAYVVSHATGEDQETVMKNIARAADARGHIFRMGADGKEHVDPAMLNAEIEAAVHGLILGQGFINSGGILQMAKMAGIAGRGQDANVFYSTGVESGIMLGASKTGVAETGLVQQFLGGTMTKKVAEHMTEAGFFRAGDWHSGGSGGVVVNPGVAKKFAGVLSDPQAYFGTGDGAVAIKRYADKNHISNMMAILQLLGRQTTQRLVADFMGNNPQFDRARSIFGGMDSVKKQYDELMGNDLDTNIIAVTAAWKSFMEAFSDAGVPVVIPILHGLTDAIHFFMVGVAEHPDTAGALIGLAGGIASLTALGGGITLFLIAWRPLVTALKFLTGLQALAATGAGVSAVGTGIGEIAAVSGLAALGGLLSGVAAGLGVIAGTVLGIQWLADKFGPRNPDGTPSNHYNRNVAPGQRDRLHPADPSLNFDGTDGTSSPTPWHNFHTPGKQSMGDVYLDGRKVGYILADHIADQLGRSQSGGNSPDIRVGALMPGSAGNWAMA
jgi:hypothetical protein